MAKITIKNMKVDVEEMKKFKEQNSNERLKFIDFWANYVKKSPDLIWSKQQKELIDSQYVKN